MKLWTLLTIAATLISDTNTRQPLVPPVPSNIFKTSRFPIINANNSGEGHDSKYLNSLTSGFFLLSI